MISEAKKYSIIKKTCTVEGDQSEEYRKIQSVSWHCQDTDMKAGDALAVSSIWFPTLTHAVKLPTLVQRQLWHSLDSAHSNRRKLTLTRKISCILWAYFANWTEFLLLAEKHQSTAGVWGGGCKEHFIAKSKMSRKRKSKTCLFSSNRLLIWVNISHSTLDFICKNRLTKPCVKHEEQHQAEQRHKNTERGANIPIYLTQ